MQIHKRFTTEKVKFLLRGYCEGTLDRPTIEEVLEINRSRFFKLLEKYRHDRDDFSIAYQRVTHSRLPPEVEKEIEKELMLEKSDKTPLSSLLLKCICSAVDMGYDQY